jgi:hypothetical protein
MRHIPRQNEAVASRSRNILSQQQTLIGNPAKAIALRASSLCPGYPEETRTEIEIVAAQLEQLGMNLDSAVKIEGAFRNDGRHGLYGRHGHRKDSPAGLRPFCP